MGPAQAILNVPGFDRLVGKPFRLTTVHSLLGVHRVRDLRREAVDARRLMVPPDYSPNSMARVVHYADWIGRGSQVARSAQ
jgi:hypothetical protein